ncbi:hypothetical protein QJS10_CPB04g01261 [Acorus calamus]|uniref:Uncharacterized protein n=1 Tax=Acorus calamus TaxID=4465 RepID=A0AAV9F2D5_ACOCL|nr:hypothetical protein QJS10_CPB04g01261 [Acorus calamus]
MAGKEPAAAPAPQRVCPAPSRALMTRLLKQEFKKDELAKTPTPYVAGQQYGRVPETMMAPMPSYDCWASRVNPDPNLVWGGIGQQSAPATWAFGLNNPPGRTLWGRPPSH